MLLYIYKKFIKPLLQRIEEEKELERRKKFDADLQAAYEERVRAARERAQRELQIEAAKAQERLEEAKQRKLEEAMEKANLSGGHTANVCSETPTSGVDPRTFVTDLIKSAPVVVFSKSYCPYCRNAKRALSAYRIPEKQYKIVELDGRPDCDQIQDVLQEVGGARTVPRVFIGGRCIGGGSETVAAQKDGTLEKMLKEAGAI
ncbi:unnamed protein product [Gongylonema pulchrum]|uniref:Glutaredoxin domain-containing protein n=1 Tax=Gongylonema pulchrum TaxID=637853 RepID=A0A3P7QN39_9BILA|nr:unnamed protein product [Gongylonema pulchrum]